MEVYLVRHTAVSVASGVCYGQSEVMLRPEFREDIRDVMKKLPAGFDAVYSSPSSRCQQLASYPGNTQVILDKRLMEMNFGHWEMKKWNEIPEGELLPWTQDFIRHRPPGGESFLSLELRVHAFIRDLLDTDYKRVLIVTHSGPIRHFVRYVLGFPAENFFRITVTAGQAVRLRIGRDKNEGALLGVF